MTEDAKVRLSRFPWWFWVVMAGLFAILVVALGWFLQSPAFQEIVRHRVIAELEKATGGTVELHSITWNVSKLEVEAKGITIRGLEPATEAPLVHLDRLYARVHVISFFSADIDLPQLTLDQPVVHIIVKPDGSTNVPEPKVKSNGDPMQQLFGLQIGRAEVRNGAVLVNQEKIPLDFKANDVGLQMGYQWLEKRYDGTVHVGKIDAQFQEMRNIPAVADAEFSLWGNHAQVRRFKLTSQKSSLEAAGTVENFEHPKVQLAYSGTLDLAQVGEIVRAYKLRGGGANLSGSGTFGADNLVTSGKLSLRGVTYDEPGLEIRDANAAAEFSLDRERILLTKIEGRMLGGSVTGEAEVKHYAPALEVPAAQVSSEKPGETAKPAAGTKTVVAQQQGSVNLKVAGASLMELVRMLESRELPLEKLNPAGSVNGTVSLAWKESVTRAKVEIAADAVASAQAQPGQLPMSGSFRGSYDVRSGTTEIATLNLATPHTEASASGVLGVRSATLQIAANTNSLTELQPLLSAMGQQPVPLEINGRTAFNGTVSGPLRSPDIVGRVLATDVSYLYTPGSIPTPAPPASKLQALLHLTPAEPEPKPAPPPRHIHVDSFAADIQYERTMLAVHNGVIEEGTARLNADGSVQLADGAVTNHSPFDVKVSLRDANVADLQKIAGTEYPIVGVLNVKLQATGTAADPHGKGSASLSGGEAYGHAIRTATSDIVVEGREVQFQGLRVEALGGEAAGSVVYNLDTGQVRSDLRGENIDLAQVSELKAIPVQEHGIVRFTLKTSGTLQQPVVDAHVEVANLAINDEMVGNFALDAVTQGNKLQITGRSRFPQASFDVDGTVDETGELQSELRLQFHEVNINPLLTAELRATVTGHSSLNGRATLSGPLRQPRALKGAMQVDAFSVEVQHLAVQSDGPFELDLADQVVTVKRLGLKSGDSNLSVGGTVDFKGDRTLDLYAKSHLNMALFHTLDDEITSYGTSDADVTVKGTLAKPVMNGRVVIAHAGFSVIDLPAALGEVNGTMVFNQDKLEVEHLAGRVGGGQITFSGFITYGSSIGFDLKSSGTDIRFRYAGMSVTANQDLRLFGTLKSSALTGDVTITRFAQIPSTEITGGFASQAPEIPNPASPLNNLRLDVRIVSTPDLTVQTALAKLSGDVDLRLRGTGTRPALLGRINVAEGDINLNGTKYHLDRGDITFANPIRIDPILDVEATTRVRDYDITIGLHGTIEKLTTTYRSDPPLSSDDIIALLAFGRTQEPSVANSGGASLGEGAGGLVLGSLINQTVSNRASKLFGVSAIRINPSIGGADNNPSARLTIEQQVSNNVTLTYITNLTQSAQQVVQFEYNINSEYTVQGIRDENGVVSFDLLIRKRKK
jgi:translocation and assembly module TamB